MPYPAGIKNCNQHPWLSRPWSMLSNWVTRVHLAKTAGGNNPGHTLNQPVFCMPAATPFMQMMRQSSTAAL